MSAHLASIPTRYKNITFRSRLEASWAEYFDFVGIEWSYEPEGYILSNGRCYLPDFFLPKLDMFVECRGPLTRSLVNVSLFLSDSGKRLLLALPEGRFFLADNRDSETGEFKSRFISALRDSDIVQFERFQKNISCIVFLEDDAIGENRVYFANYGDSSDAYVGTAPDWWNSIKDRSRIDGGDARANYYAGYSSWGNRGFEPSRWSLVT